MRRRLWGWIKWLLGERTGEGELRGRKLRLGKGTRGEVWGEFGMLKRRVLCAALYKVL